MDHTAKTRRNLHIGHELNQRLSERARTMGVSPNALALMLIDQGLRYEQMYARFNQTPGVGDIPRDGIAFRSSGAVVLDHNRILKKKKKKRRYTPPDYVPETDTEHQFPKGMRPMPWSQLKPIGDWLTRHARAQPKDIAREFKIPQLDAVVAHDAFHTEFYANQLELIEKKGKP